MSSQPRSSSRKNHGLQSTADAELMMLRMRLNKKHEFIALLELELFNTRVALHEFMLVYQERIAPLEHYLRDLRRKLYENLEAQHGEQNGNKNTDPETDETRFSYQEKNDNNGWRKIGQSKRSDRSPKMEEQIRNLFRELARRFHPDLTSDPVEKKWREDVMTRVNQAYANRDIKTLRALAEQPDRAITSPEQTKEQEITFLKIELKRLDVVISDLKARINHMEESPAWQLKSEARLKRHSGKDLFTEMEDRLKDQIADLEEHLTVLGIDYKTVNGAAPSD